MIKIDLKFSLSLNVNTKLPRILYIFSHQVGAEHEALCLVNSLIQREQVTHLAHEGGRLLVSHQGLGHQSLVPLGSSLRRSLRDSSGGNSAVFHRGVLQTVLKEG